jgi:hypothetical protein
MKIHSQTERPSESENGAKTNIVVLSIKLILNLGIMDL